MGLFARSRTVPARVEPTMTTAPETRAGGDGWASLSTVFGGTGGVVSPTAALNLSTVFACVSAVADGLATLPAYCYRREGAGRVEIPRHPVARLLRAPNPNMTWPVWLSNTVSSLLLQGNALSWVERDGAGRPIGLHPIDWAGVSVQVLPSGRVAYDVDRRRYLQGEVFHLKENTTGAGIVGRSRLSLAPQVIQGALGLQNYSTTIWDHAATPSGMVTLPPKLDADGIRRVRAQWEGRYTGRANVGRVVYAEAGQEYTPFSFSPEDAEVLASRKFSVIELARLYGVPPPLIQSYEFNSFTNAGQANTWFATNCLAVHARRVEAEFSRSVFNDPSGDTHLEIDLSGLLRGDYATRSAANVAAVQAGILTVNECREMDGFPPLPEPAAVPPTEPTLPAPGSAAAGA